MKSKTSFFNKGLFFSNMKRYSWVSLVWAALLFLAVPMVMLTFDMNIERAYWKEIDNMRLFMQNFGGIIANLMLCGFPVLIGVLMFRYLHSPKSATVLHGMPFSRLRLFTNAVSSGLVLMLFPLLLNTAVILIIKATMPVGQLIEYATIFTWLLNSVCMAFVVFALTVFVGMFTGNIMAHFVFTYIIHFLPLGLWLLVNELFTALVYGYKYIAPPEWLTQFPMVYFMRNFIECDAAYAIAGVILLALALLVYRKRPLENASDIVVFRFIRPVFKYGVTFCMAIAGCCYFYFIFGGNQQSPSIVVALIFTVIGYAIAQMLLQKTWRIWNSYKGLLVSVAVIFVFWGAIEFDITGYERRVPAVPDVESVTVMGLSGAPAGVVELKDGADIALITDLHKKFTENEKYKTAEINNRSHVDMLSIIYQMKNGGMIRRMYRYSLDDYNQEMAAVYDLPAVREQGFPIIKKTADDIDAVQIRVFSEDKAGHEYRIANKAQINDLLNVYKVDVNNLSGEALMNGDYHGADMVIQFEMRPEKDLLAVAPGDSAFKTQQYTTTYSYNIGESYQATITWLNKYVFEQEE